MFRYGFLYPMFRPLCAGMGLILTLLPSAVRAAPAVQETTSLGALFEAAWARQPESRSLNARQAAVEAQREVADSWMAGPPTLDLSTKGDQLHGNGGTREHIAGVSVPLWLPGERDGSGAVANAERQAVNSRTLAAQWRTAGELRDRYWQWQRARLEAGLAAERVHKAKQLAADVVRRVKAGDLSRLDQHQAEALVAQAEVEQAAVNASLSAATQQLRALTGRLPTENSRPPNEAISERLPADFMLQEARHPALLTLADQAGVARSNAALAQVQTRANPELSLATTRERDDASDNYQGSLTLGIRIPLGSDSRNRARQAQAQAAAIEADTQLELARERAEAEREAAIQRLEAARHQQQQAAQRQRLAQESLGFVDKSFRLGETDLPTRLRAERDAIEARQQAALAQLELAAATSGVRQALGLLPE